MAEEKKETWLNYVALTTVIFAVCATLSTFKGGQYSTRSVMSQSQASDQWAYYQAKSIKSYLYEGRQETLALQLQTEHPGPEQKAELEKRIATYAEQTKRYEQEKAEISAKAKTLEEARDQAQRISGVFGLAIIFLQIAILLSSIAAFMKKKPVWLLGGAVGAVGMVYFANGFLLFF
jgi:hypothetical protein